MRASILAAFAESLKGVEVPARLHEGSIRENAPIEGPHGVTPLIHTDNVASGRPLAQLGGFVRDPVQPLLRQQPYGARVVHLAAQGGADEETSVVIAGSGAITADYGFDATTALFKDSMDAMEEQGFAG